MKIFRDCHLSIDMSHIIQVQTSTGFANITLNCGWLLCVFYFNPDEMSVGSVHFRVQNERVLYDNGWNLKVLTWLIETYQPKFTLPINAT